MTKDQVAPAINEDTARKIAEFGGDAIATLCAKYDKDRNGKFEIGEVRSIVNDLRNEKTAKKAYKGFAIALFVIVVLALVSMFGTSLAANQVLKDTALDASGAMKSMDGTPVSVDVTENPNGLFDLPRMSAAELW